MKEYKIIEIEDNKGGTDGHIIIVKANIVEEDPAFECLSKMFGKRYCTYAVTETSSTEWFIYPFSDSTLAKLMAYARQEDTEDFWIPNMSLFYDAQLLIQNGDIKNIHKSIEFKYSKINVKEELQTFIPPVSERVFRHKIIEGFKCIVYPATQTNVEDKPDGGWTYDSGKLAFFVFSDTEKYCDYLKDAMMLEPFKKEFWKPNLSQFEKIGIKIQGPFGNTDHNLYVSYELPVDIMINNLNLLLGN